VNARVAWLTEHAEDQAAVLAHTLGLAIVTAPPDHGYYLQQEPDGLTLHHATAAATDNGLRLDFLGNQQQRRAAGGRQSLLAKAFGLHRHPPCSVIDTTCGMGRDSLMLATLGCPVRSLERHPALYALLADARARAEQADSRPDWLARWAAPIFADAQTWLDENAQTFTPDAIYIDPMFAGGRRKAQPQKALAWLSEIAGADTDAAELLACATQHARRRVVVKQHHRSAPLAPPDNQIVGKAVRFDIYLKAPAQG
jgi:16S rRNA (guanine1516-N2)-methyltransferase